MMRSVECPKCGMDLVVRSNWVERTIRCRQCGRQVALTYEMFGLKSPPKRQSRSIYRRGASILCGLVLLLSLSALSPALSTFEAIQDPLLLLRCTHCDRSHESGRDDWEQAALNLRSLDAGNNRGAIQLLEQTQVPCPHCGEIAAMQEHLTAECERCGHLAPALDPFLPRKFYQPLGCRHCKPAIADIRPESKIMGAWKARIQGRQREASPMSTAR